MAGLTHYCPKCKAFSYHREDKGARSSRLKCPSCGHVARQRPHPATPRFKPAGDAPLPAALTAQPTPPPIPPAATGQAGEAPSTSGDVASEPVAEGQEVEALSGTGSGRKPRQKSDRT